MERKLNGHNAIPLEHEPWVHIPNALDLNSWNGEKRRQFVHSIRQPAKYEFYMQVFDFINEMKIQGDYLEFGCHNARTFRMALTEARRYEMESMRFLAFDSFEGLPPGPDAAEANPKWHSGAFAISERAFLEIVEAHGIYVDRVQTIAGFYDESLSPVLQERLKADGVTASLICVDCDLYESAVPVLNFAELFLQDGTILYLDDYGAAHRGNPRKGLPAAFREFQSRSEFRFEPFMNVGWWGRSFVSYRP